MNPSRDCLELIKEAEGLARELPDGNISAYLDPIGIATIGYGSIQNIDQGRSVQLGDVITKADAERWLMVEVGEKAEAVNTQCKVPMTQGMFDALVSFTYNVGSDSLRESTLLRKLNAKDYEGAANEFDRWVYAKGDVLPGLVIRRKKEEALFRRDGFPGDDVIVSIPLTMPLTKAYQSPQLPLQISRTLEIGSMGEDCYILNCALAKLGFLAMGTQPNSFTSVTKEGVLWFQNQYQLVVDGKFDFKTKTALTTALSRVLKRLPDPMLGRVYCKLTQTSKVDADGLVKLLLEFVGPQGHILDSLEVTSGTSGYQEFRVSEDPGSGSGSFQPIPQARYIIGDIIWANGKDNYDAEHAHPTNAIGPVFVPLIKMRNDDCDAFGFHLDWNKTNSIPNTGCICIKTLDEMKKLVSLLRRYDPRDLFVDWELR